MKKKYSVLSNIGFILKIAYDRRENKLLLYVFFDIICLIGISLIELFITPLTIKLVGEERGLGEILTYIGILMFLLYIFKANNSNFVRINLFRKIEIRLCSVYKTIKKFVSMSYPLTIDTKVLQAFSNVQMANDNNDSAFEAIFDAIRDVCVNLVLIVIYLILLSKLPLIIIVITVSTSLISFFISRKIKEWRFNHREEESRYNTQFNYLFKQSRDKDSSKDIKLFGLKEWFDDLFDHAMFSYRAFLNKSSKKLFLAGVLQALFDLLRNGITYYYLFDLLINKNLDVANFLLLFATQGKFSADISVFFIKLYDIVRYSNDITILREFTDIEDDYSLNEGQKIPSNGTFIDSIELRNVYFKYKGAEDYILEDINLSIKRHDKVAMVGMNGSGKTTLVKIIMGLLQPTKGIVLVNGKDLRSYNRIDYYKIFSAVLQEYSIVPESIKTNIILNKHFDYKKLKKVIKYADLENKVASLEKGVDTAIGKEIYEDGVEFSGGEIQRLLLARAIYKSGEMLILDEPTAALDPIAEKSLYEKYNELTKDSTSIFISHRMASTRFCDYILMIKDKKIIEKGTHEELIARNGYYKYLYDVQSKYYREDVNE